MKTHVSLKIFKDTRNIIKFYWFCYCVNNYKHNPIFINFFPVNKNEFNIFVNLINSFSDDSPKTINLQINKVFYDKYIKPQNIYSINEYLTPKEKELDIRSIIVKKPDKIFDENEFCSEWLSLYSTVVEMPDNFFIEY